MFKIIDLSYTVEAKHKFYPQLLVNSGLINVNYYYVIIRDLIPKISTHSNSNLFKVTFNVTGRKSENEAEN